MPTPNTPGERLRQFAEKRYGSVYKLSKQLGITPSSLHQYVSGRRQLGNKMQNRLRELGVDVEFIMTGKTSFELHKEREKKAPPVVAFHAPGHMSEEMQKTIQKLIEDLSALPPGEVERAREIIRAAFKKK